MSTIENEKKSDPLSVIIIIAVFFALLFASFVIGGSYSAGKSRVLLESERASYQIIASQTNCELTKVGQYDDLSDPKKTLAILGCKDGRYGIIIGTAIHFTTE